jgi:hypothetical protein
MFHLLNVHWTASFRASLAAFALALVSSNARAACDAALDGAAAIRCLEARIAEIERGVETLRVSREGTKICSAHADVYIDTIVVPKSWTATTCKSWAGQKRSFHLGCIFPDTVSINYANGATPSPNCGW